MAYEEDDALRRLKEEFIAKGKLPMKPAPPSILEAGYETGVEPILEDVGTGLGIAAKGLSDDAAAIGEQAVEAWEAPGKMAEEAELRQGIMKAAEGAPQIAGLSDEDAMSKLPVPGDIQALKQRYDMAKAKSQGTIDPEDVPSPEDVSSPVAEDDFPLRDMLSPDMGDILSGDAAKGIDSTKPRDQFVTKDPMMMADLEKDSPERKLASMAKKEAAEPRQTDVDDLEPDTLEEVTQKLQTEEGPTLLDRLKEAQEDRRSKMQRADIIEAAGMIGAGAAGVKHDASFYDKLRKRAGMPVQELEEQISGKKQQSELKELELQAEDDKQLRDPKSSISEAYKAYARKSGLNVSDNMSAKDLQKLGLKIQTQTGLTAAQLYREEERRAAAAIRRSDKLDKNIYDTTQDFEKHYVTKELEKQGLSFNQADALMDSIRAGNEIAMGALGTKMARAMGEVGVLTDEDVKRYITAMSVARKVGDKAKLATMGSPGRKTLKDLEEINSKMLEGFGAKRKAIYSKYVNKAYENFGKKAGYTKEEIETRFGMSGEPSTENTVPEGNVAITIDGKPMSIPKANLKKAQEKYKDRIKVQ